MIWRDVRGPGWTKRARIYEAPAGTLIDWRVELIDTTHQVNVFVRDGEQAREVVEMFRGGAGAVEVRDAFDNAK